MNQDRIQADLAWLSKAPRLMDLGGITPPTSELLPAPLESLSSMADAIACDYLEKNQRVRLGHYVERLWQALLNAQNDTEVLAYNLGVRDPETPTRTLGELDLLYRTGARIEHLEFAAKFFLGLPQGPGAETSMARWIGMSGTDSLARKTAHLLRHQLPMARKLFEHPPRALAALDGDLRSRMHVTGALFYPWIKGNGVSLSAPEGAALEHERGVWMYFDDAEHALSELCITHLVRLYKPHWLSPPPLETLEPIDSVLEAVREAAYHTHQALWGLTADQRLMRLVIAPPHWPDRIGLPPTPPITAKVLEAPRFTLKKTT
ncbi:DUF1853 family protein [Larsenimonas suaedae]|uniref:DUF1853 family protein n=1 Tax=Larsenimonas suaedae TaxID=1851019 RepID=A0ABU1GXK4_9GAMM|nr:DUF1853 family protein [Larsenimonas suaedae]MCM2971515.1 DUF1853 family protein [Larsenimonas suaedae]MDR5896771.1 DUF1853 family protein [Larsenimonas suaedae]